MSKSEAINCALKVLMTCKGLDTEMKLPKEVTPEMEKIIDNTIQILYYLCNNNWQTVGVQLREFGIDPIIYLH